jgi:ACS family glucarate transporter-like MFS transporter
MTGLIGLVTGWGGLILCRVLLGVFQSGATPSWAKGVSEWFPKQERGFAVSVYDNGIRVGALLSVPVMAILITHFGWRLAFVGIGILGILWTPLWLWVYRTPRQHSRVNQAELAYIERAETSQVEGFDTRQIRWVDLLRFPTTWGVILVAFFAGSQVYFFLTWLPTYLISVRHFSLLREGVLGIMPLLSSALGGIAGGLVGDWLVRRGHTLNFSRKFCIVVGLLLAGCTSPAAWLNDDVLIIALMSIGLAANAFASVAIFALPLDVTPVASRTASLAAMQMSGTMAGGLCYPILVGYILEWTHGDFRLPIIGSGIIAMLGLVIFLLLVRDVAPLPIDWDRVSADRMRRVSAARN